MAYERKHFPGELEQMQSLSLDSKVRMSIRRIRDWYEYWDGNVCVSFSGGKDSTVLLDLVRSVYPDVRAVFSNTGLEYPEIQRFAMSKPNVDVVTPKMRFPDVVTKYGYPLISKEVAEAIYYARKIRGANSGSEARRTMLQGKYDMGGVRTRNKEKIRTPRIQEFRETKRRRGNLTGVVENGETSQGGVFSGGEPPYERGSQFNKEKYLPLARDIPVKISHYCCHEMKKSPMKKYQTANGFKPILGILAEESRLRKQSWERNGCNAYETKDPKSAPMSFWTEQDVLRYIVEHDLEICSVYGDIVTEDEDGMQYAVSPINLVGNKLKCSKCQRTGCIFCAFGFHNEKGETRFQRLAKTHPKQYDYCMRGGAMG